MNTPKIVEALDCKAELIEHLRKQQTEKKLVSKTNGGNSSNDQAGLKLIALANVAKDNEHYTISGIILDIIKSRYNEDYQLYLKQ